MTVIGQLWIEASQEFVLPGSSGSNDRRWAAPRMRALFWPSGKICWEINLYLVFLKKIGSAVSTINTYASELSSYIKYISRINVNIASADDDVLVGYSDFLISQGKSGTHTNRLILRVLNYYQWYQRALVMSDIIGELGAGCQITVRVKLTHRGHMPSHAAMYHFSMVPNSSSRVVKPISAGNLKKIVSAADSSNSSRFKRVRDRCLVTLLADTGIRREESTFIKCADILEAKSNGGRLTVRTSKRRGNPQREVPIPSSTLTMMLDYVEIYRAMHVRGLSKNKLGFVDAGWVFPTVSGDKLAPVTISQLFNKLRKEAGITGKATPHMLRHRYITLQVKHRLDGLRKNNLGLEAITTILAHVASLTGHGSTRSLWTYVDWAFEELDSAASSDRNVVRELLADFMADAEAADNAEMMDAIKKVQQILNEKGGASPQQTVAMHSLRNS